MISGPLFHSDNAKWHEDEAMNILVASHTVNENDMDHLKGELQTTMRQYQGMVYVKTMDA